ncbi:TonB-dependent siderophore receptor [Steroidobacter sp. S1-65]|uniref:TonB-dependent siderophore receptor n=1 Tax=Steroidobacter gossypii TaxID=2805490 RepID=A0ABS1WZ72_9GAMM|nr:TonB-dependent siderophore receptor [Steroidobacter gossypii]MBM0106279.1 TonB-dependent siderophore receptor [Steroidobacter gossypii]
MRIGVRRAVALAVATASGASYAQSPTDLAGQTLETLVITAKRADRVSKGATGLDMDIAETPQSISVVSAEQMNDFGADDINEALRLVTGINVEEWETNRTNYMARGFEIKNTQVDGVGLPNDWGIVHGAMDSFGYEKIEVIRGANGLLTGVGNSSGTINYVRKRPTNSAQGSIGLSAGSFEQRRVEADYSTPFTADGKWAGRLVVASEDQDSYVRGLSNDRTFVYGVVDGQLGERSTLTLGASYQDANTDGNMWGALVLAYTDGTQAEFGRSASTALDWTFWDTENTTAFAEYTFALADAWDLKLTYNYRKYQDDSKLFFAFTNEGIDRETGLGLWGFPGSWPTEDEAHMFELSLSGRFELFGREHEAMLGLNHSSSEHLQLFRPVDVNDPAWGELPPFPYPGDAFAEPVWGAAQVDSRTEQTLKRAFGATRFNVTDKLRAIVGFNYSEYQRDGHQSLVLFDQRESELSPYAGLTYQLLGNLMVYGSYSDIYQPQDQYDINDRYLVASKGLNYEVGLKAEWLDERLLTTLALFEAEQEDLATFAGQHPDGQYYYEGVDVNSRGIELEVVGRIGEHVNLVLGYTTLQLEDEQDQDVYEWVPRRTANIALSARLPSFTALSFGVNGRWQSDISKLDEYTNVVIRQDSYTTLNAFARWDVTQNLHVRANVRNITDEKYITSLYQVGYYAAPRNYEFGVGYKF